MTAGRCRRAQSGCRHIYKQYYIQIYNPVGAERLRVGWVWVGEGARERDGKGEDYGCMDGIHAVLIHAEYKNYMRDIRIVCVCITLNVST